MAINWNNNKDKTKVETADIEQGKAVQGEIEKQSIVDPGEGETKILRVFKFGLNPSYRGKIDKQDLFNSHIHQIEAMLWKDGLVPNLDIAPKVTLSKKGYSIFLLCEPKMVGLTRLAVNERPKTLQQLLST